MCVRMFDVTASDADQSARLTNVNRVSNEQFRSDVDRCQVHASSDDKSETAKTSTIISDKTGHTDNTARLLFFEEKLTLLSGRLRQLDVEADAGNVEVKGETQHLSASNKVCLMFKHCMEEQTEFLLSSSPIPLTIHV